ncbi:hypothetical protein HaLaN_10792 [Haematococcus lacustris]|uniref:Uncharacterized protein n=1 Tax=Haematococcus lacustris TaxID=44745 RepID=A0A699YWQ3_HAELA|nr:hypothetical protein HaLaN_10792 [Haematococcus lacustris]
MAIHDASAGLSDFEKQRLERIRLNKLRMNAILDAKQALDAACNNEAPRASRAPAIRKEPKEQEVIERKSLRSRSQVVSYRDSARFSFYDEEKPKRPKAAGIGRARAPRQPGTSGGSGAYTTEAVSKMPGVWHPCLYGVSKPRGFAPGPSSGRGAPASAATGWK